MKEIMERYGKLAGGCSSLSCGNVFKFIQVEQGFQIADLGCGRGQDVIALAEMTGEKGMVYGIDITDEMLEKAKENAKTAGVQNITFLKNELEKMDIGDNKLDLIVSNCTINHAGDKLRVWQEIFRTLKPGGKFVISDIYATEEVPEQYKNDSKAVAECWAGAQTRDKYLETMEKAGFKNVRILKESSPYEKGKIMAVSITLEGQK